jgi:ferredoxin
MKSTGKFCPSCGLQIPLPAVLQPAAPPQQYSPQAPQPPQQQYPPQPQPGAAPQYGQQAEQQLRDRTLLLREQFGSVITQGNYKEILQSKENPVTKTFIDFIAWGIMHFWNFTAFLAAVTVLGVLLGGWGVVLAVALTFVYSKHKEDIQARLREMKGDSAGTRRKGKGYSYFIEDRCNGCGICRDICPQGAIFPAGELFAIYDERCDLCGRCIGECPVRAIVKY